MSKLTEAGAMAQALDEKYNLAEEEHQSETSSLNRKIASLTEQATESQEVVTQLRTELLESTLVFLLEELLAHVCWWWCYSRYYINKIQLRLVSLDIFYLPQTTLCGLSRQLFVFNAIN